MDSSIDIVPMDSDTVSVDCSENYTGEVNPDVDYSENNSVGINPDLDYSKNNSGEVNPDVDYSENNAGGINPNVGFSENNSGGINPGVDYSENNSGEGTPDNQLNNFSQHALQQIQFASASIPEQVCINSSTVQPETRIIDQPDLLQYHPHSNQMLPIAATPIPTSTSEILQIAPTDIVPGAIFIPSLNEGEILTPVPITSMLTTEILPSVPITSILTTEIPNIDHSIPLGMISAPLMAVASTSADTYLTSQYFVDNSKVEQISVVPENVDSSDNIPELTADPIPNEIVDTNVVSLTQKDSVELSLNKNTETDDIDKSKQSEFLTTCELKESLEEESSRDSAVDNIAIDEEKITDKKNVKDTDPIDEEPEFVWEKYLENSGTVSVPPTAFKHVEYSLESGFVKGMKLEVPNKCNTDTYWVASVLMTCGPLLRLRFDGYEEDNYADFWCDLMTSEIHPIGWCAQNNEILQPPEAIKDKFDDWRDFLVRSLTGARTAPSYLLDKNTGITPVDQLKQGMRLELQHPINPLEVWLVKILENVGGRLYLRFEGVETAIHDFWLFYLNHRLHPIGWAKTIGLKYQPPKELISEDSDTDWMEILKTALKETEKYVLPLAIFKDQEDVFEHSFQEGWKLEALNPIRRNQICPATVIEVLNSQYFVVEIDDLDSTEEYNRIRFSCHTGSKCIFPAKWCHFKGIPITPPQGWPKGTFSWNDYLEYCQVEAAPETCFQEKKYEQEFEQGLKMESVNPENPNQICVATISKVIEPLMWIHLDNSPFLGTSHIEHFESHNLFPVGWCESNGYQLKVPAAINGKKKTAVVLPEISDATSEAYHMNKGGTWCPRVYYNHHCFSGPYLSKGRIASLPKSIGPGPICLVMKEAISMLINVAYKPCRVLKELQLEGKPNPDMYLQTLKAKYKGKSYRAIVELCQHAENLPDFCRNICLKLECCPNLVSPNFINGNCPENCSQLTKTKYTYYNPKKKIGRPPGGHTNLENGPKKTGKKTKKRRMKILSPGDDNGSLVDGEDDKDSIASDTKTVDSGEINDNGDKGVKRKYVHQAPIPSEIKTRGAKLPKYSFERKTHKKIPVQEKHQHHNKPKKHVKLEHTSPVKNDMKLSSNPLHWSVKEVVNFIKGTECAPIARLFVEQEIDGQALLLLTLPTVQEYLELKLGPAVKLCHHVEQIKSAFFQQYAK